MSVKTLLLSVATSLTAQLKKKALAFIVAAEKQLPGASGKDKRAFVVSQLDDLFTLPWYLESIDGPVLGMLVDVICDKLNLLTDNDKSAVAGAEEKAAVVIESASDEELSGEGSVDQKLNQLYEKYKV